MPSNMFQYNLKYMYGLESCAFWKKNQNSCYGSQIGYQNRMIQAILNVHVALIPQTKFRFNLT